jgi:hypothetical protein
LILDFDPSVVDGWLTTDVIAWIRSRKR